LPTSFNGDAFFELPSMFPITHKPLQMQGMDRKYDGHKWCKVITTNNKNSFGLSFRKARWLGHLQCLHDDCDNFVGIGSRKEILWCDECTHILMLGNMAFFAFASSFACKFYHFFSLCVADYLGKIYYVMHKLPTITKATIHFKVHKHPMADGKCKEFVDKIRRLIVEDIDHMLNAKICVISQGASKTFLAMHLLDDSDDGIVDL
jgi:hypothetical protein